MNVQDAHFGPASQGWASRLTSRKSRPRGAYWVRVGGAPTYSFQLVSPVRKVMNDCEGSKMLSGKRKKKIIGRFPISLKSYLLLKTCQIKSEQILWRPGTQGEEQTSYLFICETLFNSVVFRGLGESLNIPDR